MAAIEALGVNPVEVAHAKGEVAIRCFNQQVVVIAHETPGMYRPVIAFNRVGQHFLTQRPVRVVPVDGLLPVTAGGDVVQGTAKFEAEGAGHEGSLKVGGAKGKT